MTDAAVPSLRLAIAPLAARLDPGEAASVLARLVASRVAVTRADLARATGLARSSVAATVDVLLAAGILRGAGTTPVVGRGRPGDALALAADAGSVLVADIGASRTRVCAADLGARVHGHAELALDVCDGPERVLDRVCEQLERVRPSGAAADALGPPRVLVVGLPGPVDARAGAPVRPPIMPGWDGYPVADELSARLGCPVVVENDVNLRALGEARTLPADQCPLLYVKVGTGIGGGMVTAGGHLHHGADGAAGDIGHVRARGSSAHPCHCGSTGCIEAVASASAIAAAVSAATPGGAPSALTVDDLVGLLRRRDPVAVRHVREAAAALGEVVAMLVHFYNPARVVVGGLLSEASDDTLAGVRSVVYSSALPLATRNLVLTHSVLGPRAGVTGGLVLGLEEVLSPGALTAAMARGR